MKAKLYVALFARDVIVDAYKGSLSVIHLLEHVAISERAIGQGPINIGDFKLVMVWETKGEEGDAADVRLRLISPSGPRDEPINQPPGRLKVQEGNQRWITHMRDFRVDKPGRWKIAIEYKDGSDWVLAGEPSILVKFVPHEKIEQAAGLDG